MKKSIIIGILLLASAAMAQGNLGQAGANFLQIGVDARGTALGGAVTAVSRGANALYWNPAGAIFTDNIDLSFNHTDWFVDTRLTYGAAVKKLNENTAIGLSISAFTMDDMEITTVYQSEGTGEMYSAGDLCAGLSFARILTDRFTFGATVKYVSQQIWNETASQVAFDVGSLYQTDFLGLRIGMAIRNFGGKLRFEGDDIDDRIAEEEARGQDGNPRIERLTPDFRMPQIFQMGIAVEPVKLKSSSLLFLADVIVASDNEEKAAFGIEYDMLNLIVLRGGYRLGDDLGDISFGAGLNLDAMGIGGRFDYGFSARGDFGNIHRFGIGLSL